MPKRLLIDTDTASDDAMALVMALRHPEPQIEAITVVSGNVPVDQGVQNALYTVELCEQAIPVHRGRGAPLKRPLRTAQHVHGKDGMGDIGLALNGRTPASDDGVGVLVDMIQQNPGDLSLVTLGPLTNIAAALQEDPTIAQKVAECIIMGGTGQGPGNVTPVAEYNYWADPEAAKIVFESGMPIKMVGWDVATGYATISSKEKAALRAIDTPLAHFCLDIQTAVVDFMKQRMGSGSFALADPIAMAVALEPAVATRTERLFVTIETDSDLCRGQSVVDHMGVLGKEPNAAVVFEASNERFLEMMAEAVK